MLPLWSSCRMEKVSTTFRSRNTNAILAPEVYLEKLPCRFQNSDTNCVPKWFCFRMNLINNLARSKILLIEVLTQLLPAPWVSNEKSAVQRSSLSFRWQRARDPATGCWISPDQAVKLKWWAQWIAHFKPPVLFHILWHHKLNWSGSFKV